MGEMQRQLEGLLSSTGQVSAGTVPFPRLRDITHSQYASTVDTLYRTLGGILDVVPLNLRAWDIEFDGLAVELDEYLHFNRYRAVTLDNNVYDRLAGFPLEPYRRYCKRYEPECLKAGSYGGRWSNRSCDVQFGRASAPKDFTGAGPSRWKQRAFYDFIKDLTPHLLGAHVARIAVWDTLQDGNEPRHIAQILKQPRTTSAHAIAELIHTRAF